MRLRSSRLDWLAHRFVSTPVTAMQSRKQELAESEIALFERRELLRRFCVLREARERHTIVRSGREGGIQR